jgi:beta-phosphoglucomutase-like phosphatase (HAD superfamily)
MPSPVLALLCDADGNLFPSEEPAFAASAEVTNAFLAELGLPTRFEPEELRLATTGKSFRTTAVDLAVAHGVPVEAPLARRHPHAVVASGPGALTVDALERWVAEERRQVTAHLGQVLRPDPEVLGPLTTMAGACVLAAVSSSALARLDACFRATGLDALLPPERRFSAEDSLAAPTSKPDPAVYLHACAELGVSPARCLAVEDSPVGAASAVAAGVPTVGNLQFVPEAERRGRVAELRSAGVVDVVTTWAEVEPRAVPARATA